MAESSLQIGDKAPDFNLISQHQQSVALKDLLKKGPVVIFFYPKDDTRVCTAEACAFRDAFTAFNEIKTTVVGISSDSVESHKAFATKYNLQFLLLSDPLQEVRNAFGVPKMMGMMPGRVTYVIDANGIIQHVYNASFRAKEHVEQALRALKKLSP
jgi:peroxiredoxin Q/BCP